jgi:hypothetical protein
MGMRRVTESKIVATNFAFKNINKEQSIKIPFTPLECWNIQEQILSL